MRYDTAIRAIAADLDLAQPLRYSIAPEGARFVIYVHRGESQGEIGRRQNYEEATALIANCQARDARVLQAIQAART